jgi:hypothetical protein
MSVRAPQVCPRVQGIDEGRSGAELGYTEYNHGAPELYFSRGEVNVLFF